VRIRVSTRASQFAVVVCAESLRHATESVRARYPGSAVGIAFPIEPEHFFVGDDHRGAIFYPEAKEELVR
jgi:hypothetical protein